MPGGFTTYTLLTATVPGAGIYLAVFNVTFATLVTNQPIACAWTTDGINTSSNASQTTTSSVSIGSPNYFWCCVFGTVLWTPTTVLTLSLQALISQQEQC